MFSFMRIMTNFYFDRNRCFDMWQVFISCEIEINMYKIAHGRVHWSWSQEFLWSKYYPSNWTSYIWPASKCIFLSSLLGGWGWIIALQVQPKRDERQMHLKAGHVCEVVLRGIILKALSYHFSSPDFILPNPIFRFFIIIIISYQ